MSHELQTGNLTGDPLPKDHASSFFRSEAFGAALARARFTVDEEVRMLVGFMRDADAKVALPAQAAFRRTLSQVATADGMIGKQTLTVRDGTGRKLSVSRSMLPLPEERPNEPTLSDFAAACLPPAERPCLPEGQGTEDP